MGESESRPAEDGGPEAAVAAFRGLVNMSASELRAWLDSIAAGHEADGMHGEAGDRRCSRRILEVLERGGRPPRDAGQAQFLREVVGHIRRQLAQRPEGDTAQAQWRHSLVHWGDMTP